MTTTTELSITLVDRKTPFDEYILLPSGRAKPAKVCAILSDKFVEEACQLPFEAVIVARTLPEYVDKRRGRKLARDYDVFIADKESMPLIAKTIGRWLGVLGKMPNAKQGQVIINDKELKHASTFFRDAIHLKSHDGVIGTSILDTNTNFNAVLNAVPKYKKIIIKHTPMGKPERWKPNT